jgi:tartrate-resistant acid phosphatase type 5
MPLIRLTLSLSLLLIWGWVGCQGESSDRRSSSRQRALAPPPEVNLLAMGDWGSGQPGQKAVANALVNYVRASNGRFDGMLLAGDNFYPQLFGTDDPQWRTLFEEMYDPKVLNFPFYVTLGNRDYDDDHPNKDIYELEYARENPQSRWKLPARHYRLDIPEIDPVVTVLMLDSNHDPQKGNEDKPESLRWQTHMAWLERELAKPRRSKWLICVAHHPLFTNGDHGDDPVMQYTWGPLFRETGWTCTYAAMITTFSTWRSMAGQ